MNAKRLFLTILAVLALTNFANAQQSKSDESVEFRPHWNIQLQGGASYTLGEAGFGDLISPAAYLSAGYKFHHMLGVRVGVGGWQAKGCATIFDEMYKYNFIQGNADFILDLNSMFGGFNHRRVANVYLFAGVGVVGAFNNDEANALALLYGERYEFSHLWDGSKVFVAGRLGLGIDFRCGERFSVGLEANANFMSDKFNSKKAENVDWHFNLLAGVSYRFGKNHRPSVAYAKAMEEAARVAAEKAAAEKAAAEKAAAEKAAAELAAKKAAEAKAAAEKAAAEKAAAEKAAQAAAEKAAIAKANSNEILFLIGSYRIRPVEGKKIDTMSKWLSENKDFTVLVVGYADKTTGTPALNQRLSERRAAAVKARLMAGGVEESRIVVDAKGDKVQPYAEPVKNRVVICTVE